MKNSLFFKIKGCTDCSFSAYCKRFMKNKNEDFKIFEVNMTLQKFIKESEDNLLSVEGIEMRINRSAQVEGAFGVIKQNISYERFRRRSLEKVSAEMMLVSLGYNFRKLFRFFDGNLKYEYWNAPSNLEPQKFKKPSALKLSKKANKIKIKSLNQINKSSYKYKETVKKT